MLYLRWLSCTNSYCQLIRSHLGSFKFSKIMDALSIQILCINQSKINPKSTHQGYPIWGALALIRVWPWIKLICFGPKSRFAQMGLILFFSMLYLRWLSCTNSYCQLIRSYLGSFKFSKIMDALSIPILYINQSKINPKSTHQGYPPWGALAPIRVWPWIKLFFWPKPRFAQSHDMNTKSILNPWHEYEINTQSMTWILNQH